MTRRTYTIATIVEGYGETLAVPILLQRWLKYRRFLNFEVADPIRASSVDAIKAPYKEELQLGIVLASRQYETWLLASLRTLQRAGKIPADTKLPRYADIEAEQGCKDKLSKLLGRKYNERNDQPDFTRYLPFTAEMKTKSRSYLHLLTTLERLVAEARN